MEETTSVFNQLLLAALLHSIFVLLPKDVLVVVINQWHLQ